jgi:hypothetical protein
MEFKKEIQEWKKQGHTVLEVPFDDGKTAFFKTPNRQELKLIFSKAPKGGPVAMTDTFVKNCLLGGHLSKDEICGSDTKYIAQLAASIDDLLGTKQVEIKKH